jgi:protein FAM50
MLAWPAQREAKEAELRKQLEAEWYEKQERIKQESISITFSYWDGSGHRRSIMVCA